VHDGLAVSFRDAPSKKQTNQAADDDAQCIDDGSQQFNFHLVFLGRTKLTLILILEPLEAFFHYQKRAS
jgi:hypothetical protein